jgi:hypothetical protein
MLVAVIRYASNEFPSSAEEGWLREVRKSCEASFLRRRGGVGQDFLTITTPSAPVIRMLRDTFLGVAATPPRLRRGILAHLFRFFRAR